MQLGAHKDLSSILIHYILNLNQPKTILTTRISSAVQQNQLIITSHSQKSVLSALSTLSNLSYFFLLVHDSRPTSYFRDPFLGTVDIMYISCLEIVDCTRRLQLMIFPDYISRVIPVYTAISINVVGKKTLSLTDQTENGYGQEWKFNSWSAGNSE